VAGAKVVVINAAAIITADIRLITFLSWDWSAGAADRPQHKIQSLTE
jgi:hypothetical protein